MAACIFLFPNALLTREEANELGPAAIPPGLRDFCADGNDPVSTVLFDNEALSGSAYLQWLWMIATGRDDLFQTAPCLWRGVGGDALSKEIWLLSPYKKNPDGTLLEAPISEDIDELCLWQDFFIPIVRRYGFQLQALNNRFFATRKTAWNVSVPPWHCQEGKNPIPALGENAGQWNELSAEIASSLSGSEVNRYREGNGMAPVEGFHVNGGGFDNQLGYASIRVLQTNSPLIRGLGSMVGIPSARITREGMPWPETPDGDRLSVFSDFLDPSVKQDPGKWLETWERVMDKVKTAAGTAKGVERYSPVLVASDRIKISSLTKKNKTASLLSMFGKNSGRARDWLCPTA